MVPRVSANAPNRLSLRDGVAIAALEGGKIVHLEAQLSEAGNTIESALHLGSLTAALQRYYA